MTQIERYIFRIALGAFLTCLIGLTGTIWVTQALRELDLVTAKGQTLLVFLFITALSLPTLITVIAPVALFIACVYALNKLNGDSELIVMSAAGMPPRQLLRPFATLALAVSLVVAFLTIQVMPSSFQELRDVLTRVRGDFVANVVKEGQFTALDNGITFHFRERGADGSLQGLFIQDKREAGKAVVYLAERGRVADVDGQTYLVLEKGSIHRQQKDSRDSSIVSYERYAVDLAAFTPPDSETIYKPRERSTLALLFPDTGEGYYRLQKGRFRAELHDRLSAWLYPLALAFIAFAALGDPRTTRQGRGLAVAGAVLGVVALRIAGFAASSAAVRSPGAVVAIYAAPLGAIALSCLVIFGGARARALNERLGRFGRRLTGAVRRRPLAGRA
ncbi:lipopolysaccharide export system permease protein [Methylorubrum rhodesianum]|jgi:lipopolysaccharide export system permease protein|uniref:LPS export ABC transporter permease LptF n=2 Tax=Methylorubrum rhodesianum TaxID=29427 RepID=A0ABU9ZG96_9HYPH|nr:MULTISPECIES: LPS export ABC transporter permease LptF [Methylorubrum]MBY0143791.1 LPS export ABC transporter permease LptF [Methylorubrum populi]MRI56112.1 LPS export ABC transporter permease LptF [Methylobacterium sp. DB1607]MBB5765643.1 lipopolysaccharide export system permease protein [Methylorubrum rhodesianum]MBI1691850.1 LPS export ABC transporter permease LptF [Methylorubrum sp. DB1722]MBK3404277.1 LPS export ABC transporter permease LptF [Methylorubrum rhodesianum]